METSGTEGVVHLPLSSETKRGETNNNLLCRRVGSLSVFVNPDLRYGCTEMRERRTRKKQRGQEAVCGCVRACVSGCVRACG